MLEPTPRLARDTRPVSQLEGLLAATISRRRMIVAGLGAVYAAVGAACGGGTQTGATTSASPSSTSSATSVPLPACVVTPSETEGPYFVDERLNRSDIRDDRTGVPLAMTFSVARVGASCTALPGAQVDVWHCDALGVYSDVSAQSSVGKKFLRGYQVTDASGKVTFTTVYPGWYRGRAVHIHFKVRHQGTEFTSQIFFDDAVSDEVFQKSPYSSRGVRDMRNANDMVYTSNNNSGASLLANVSKSGGGYAASFGIGLRLA